MLFHTFTVMQLGMLQSGSEFSDLNLVNRTHSPVPRSGMGLNLVNLSGPSLNPNLTEHTIVNCIRFPDFWPGQAICPGNGEKGFGNHDNYKIDVHVAVARAQ